MDDRSYRGLFGDLPELKTERLTLRKMEMSDANDMYSYASLDEVTRYLLWTPHLNIDETKGYIEYVRREYRKGSVADWAISLDSESRMIGTVGFSAVDRENNSGRVFLPEACRDLWQHEGHDGGNGYAARKGL